MIKQANIPSSKFMYLSTNKYNILVHVLWREPIPLFIQFIRTNTPWHGLALDRALGRSRHSHRHTALPNRVMVVWGNRTTIPHSPMIIYPNGMESTGATRPQTPLSPRSLNTSLSYLQQPQKAGPFGATRRAGTQVHAFMPLLNVCWYSWKLTNNTNHKPSPAVHVIPFNYSRRVL